MKKEEKEIAEDLIVAAINDAKQKGEAAVLEEMKKSWKKIIEWSRFL